MGDVHVSFDTLVASVPVSDSRFESYYEGNVTLDALGISLPPAARVLEMAAPFPKLAVDVLAEVLTPEGYLLGDDRDTPALLRRWWQVNDMDTTVRLAITEALVQGSAYFVIGEGTSDAPRITAHPRRGMSVRRDHMGRVVEAVRQYGPPDERHAAHYQAGQTDYYRHNGCRWVLVDTIRHGLSAPPVVPMVNMLRLGDVDGRSEIAEVAKLSDAASRSLTNLQVAQELLAMPTRYLFGEGLETLRDQAGNPVDKIAAYFGRFITGPSDAKAGQIPGADLSQIINSYKLYAQSVSAITGIPPSMLGISTDNPSSAEAMKVAKERLISRAEVKQQLFGDALEEVARLSLEYMGREVDVATLEVQWRDPATPSASSKAANMLQAHAQGVIGPETAREALSLTPEQKAREAASGDLMVQMRSQMGG